MTTSVPPKLRDVHLGLPRFRVERMNMRKLTAVVASALLAFTITVSSTKRAEAHRGWGWGIGAGIAAALILGGLHRHHYYGGYPYAYGYYRPRYYGYRHY